MNGDFIGLYGYKEGGCIGDGQYDKTEDGQIRCPCAVDGCFITSTLQSQLLLWIPAVIVSYI